jgi:hypothetical protein
MENKKAQLSIFIILALAIVVVLIILFANNQLPIIGQNTSPIRQIQQCSENYIKQALDTLSVQGGTLNPQNYYLYQGNKVEYLCYTEENYKLCIMQKPLLKQAIEDEINKYAAPKIKSCIDSVKADLQSQGYSINMGKINTSVDIIPDHVLVNINSDLSITKTKTDSYKTIKADISSKYYELIMVASSIINWEARYGDSESMNYMIYYPNLKVEKNKQSDGTTIYLLTDKTNLNKFIFATRSVALPAGITGK